MVQSLSSPAAACESVACPFVNRPNLSTEVDMSHKRLSGRGVADHSWPEVDDRSPLSLWEMEDHHRKSNPATWIVG